MTSVNFITIVPHISEKAFSLAAQRKYTFVVNKNDDKETIASAVEKYFKVKVLSVHIINIPGKIKQNRKGKGRRSGISKAIVTLAVGEKIDIYSSEEDNKTKGKEQKEKTKKGKIDADNS